MNPVLKKMGLFVRDLLSYSEDLIKIGRENRNIEDFETSNIGIDTLGPSIRLASGQSFDDVEEEMNHAQQWQAPIVISFYGADAYQNANNFSCLIKSQAAFDLQETLGIGVFQAGQIVDVKTLTGQQYGNRLELSLNVIYSISATVETLYIESVEIELNHENSTQVVPIDEVVSVTINEETNPRVISEFCPSMTLSEAFALNSSSVISGMGVTVTNDGGGEGVCVILASPSITSASGKLSLELKIDSVSDDSAGSFSIQIIQGVTPVCVLSYVFAVSSLLDVNNDTLATFNYTSGETVIGLTLDQATGTATYSYKETTASSPTANAALSVDAAYNNAVASSIAVTANTAVNSVNSVTLNAGTAAFVTSVDGLGYCEF